MQFETKEELVDNVTAMIIAFLIQVVITVCFFWLYNWWWGQIILAFMTATTATCPILIAVTIHDFVKDHRNK